MSEEPTNEIDWQALSQGVQNATQTIQTQIIEPMVQAFVSFQESLKPTMTALCAVINRITESLYQTYLENGAPYGESMDGMWRYYHEQSDIIRNQQEIERMKSQIDGMRSLRQKLKERHRV